MEEHDEGSSKFFRIVFSPVSQGIRLPTLFMTNYGHSLATTTTVTLKVPTGASWSVHLRRTDSGLWLGQGWEEFAAYYAIEPRHFLYFKFQGSAQFTVIIMDPSGTEIEYPMEDEGEDEDGEEMSEFDENPGRLQATIGVDKKKRFGSYRKAEGFKTENPFFLSFMQPSYVTHRYMLSLNLSCVWDFLPTDIIINTNSQYILWFGVPGVNKVWTLTCNFYRGGRKTHVMKGWKEFAVDNELRVADVCVFELVNPAALHFNVTIFRNT